MLKPGDVLRSKVKGSLGPEFDNDQEYDLTGVVIAIDRGEVGAPGTGRRGRPATVTLLIDGPVVITREISWLVRYTTTVITA